MLCLTCYTAFRVILINTILAAFNFAVNAVGYTSNQWAISDVISNDCQSYLFIGLTQYKLGTSGSSCPDEDYQMEDIVACSDIGLKGHDCDSFEQAVYMGQSAVAMAILIVGFMVVNLWIAFGNKHNRILWFFQLSSAAANALFGCLAFAACGYFNDVLDALPSYGSNPSLGYGWGLELLTAFSAFISAALCILVLVKGIGENEANGGHNVL